MNVCVHVECFRAQRHVVCDSFTWPDVQHGLFDCEDRCHAQTCFLSPRTHWPSASSRATDTKLSCVIDKCTSGWGVIHGRWSASPLLPSCTSAPGAWDGDLLCVFFYAFLDCVVASAIPTTALPCQQDKTAVVKQSKQNLLTAAASLWCDLQTGFLLPSLAILWQAQETRSALPDKKLDQKEGKKRAPKLDAEPSHSGNCYPVFFFRAGKPLDRPAWHFLTQRLTIGESAGNRRVALFPCFSVCRCLWCVVVCFGMHPPRIYHFPIFWRLYFLVEVKSSSVAPEALHAQGKMREEKSKRGQEEWFSD